MRSMTSAPIPGALLILMLWLPSPADALQCSRDCGGDCQGGCEVNSIGCSCTSVGGACPGSVTCSEYGETVACHTSVTFKCEESDEGLPGGPETQGLRVPQPTDWAVLKYRTNHVDVMTSAHVRLIAASDARYGGIAVEEILRSAERARKLRAETREQWRRQGPSAPQLPDFPPSEERVHFLVDPAGPCARVGLRLAAGSTPGLPASGFFRVAATAGGEITAVSPLYAEEGTDVRELARWLRRNGRLELKSAVEGPVEAYVYLRAEEAGVSHIVGGGEILP